LPYYGNRTVASRACPGAVAEPGSAGSCSRSSRDGARPHRAAHGLELAAGDARLTYDPGKLKAHRGDADGALADRCRAHELDPENFAPVYSSAFLLEREGRQAEAAEAWRQIVDFATERALELTAAWPRQELQRLAGLLAECKDTGG